MQANAGQGCTFLGDVPSLGCLSQIIFNVVGDALLFIGIVTLIFLIYGSIRFVLSRGDPKALEAAQKTMTYAVLGMALVVGSFFVVNIITTTLGLPNILEQFTIFRGP
ncbi:MAG: hypothetical protein M1484_02650 [Patescibacteria group bacterium]|nr:hypothetical protein [Patescibacteria group bacterium]MCL5431981.1 hypothetical protein [Patescibacteria group bacterium]